MKRFGWVLAYIGGVALLLWLGFDFWNLKSHARISYSLDFGSLLDALVLLAVFVLIDYAYLKQSSEKRADTELLLAIVAEARSALHEVEQKSEYYGPSRTLGQKEKLVVTCSQRNFSNAVRSIEHALRHCSIDLSRLKFEEVKDARVEVNESFTDTPYPGPYDPASIGRINRSLTAMRDELTRLTFAINHR